MKEEEKLKELDKYEKPRKEVKHSENITKNWLHLGSYMRFFLGTLWILISWNDPNLYLGFLCFKSISYDFEEFDSISSKNCLYPATGEWEKNQRIKLICDCENGIKEGSLMVEAIVEDIGRKRARKEIPYKMGNFIELNRVELSQKLQYLESYSDIEANITLSAEILKYKLEKKNIKYEFKNGSILYALAYPYLNKTFNIEVKFDLNIIRYTIEYEEYENSSLFNETLKIINASMPLGRLSLKVSPNDKPGMHYYKFPLIYRSRIHTSLSVHENSKILKLIKEDIESYCIPATRRLEQVLYSRRLKPTKEVIFKLSKEQRKAEKALKAAMSKNDFHYFRIRFSTHLSIIKKGKFYYPKYTDSLESFCGYLPSAVIDQMNYIIDELAEKKIFIKTEKFPLKDFAWEEERPVYIYEKLLSDVFEIHEESSSKLTKKSYKLLDEAILGNHSSVLSAQKVVCPLLAHADMPLDTYLAPLTPQNAVARVQNYQSHSFAPAREYFGTLATNQNAYALASASFSPTFEQNLIQAEEGVFLNYLTELLGAILLFLVKESAGFCIDLSCLGFDRDGNIVIDMKAGSEIAENFRAPEMEYDRLCKASVVYSFGEILICLVRGNLRIGESRKERLAELGKECKHINVMRRPRCKALIARLNN